MHPVTLLMAIHCHQPIGNFGFVFEEAYAKAYDPFLRVLERHPRVRLALHYSGCLLDWLITHQPAFLRRVRALIRRGQVELLASGYYEPILPLIPEADRQGQIALMRAALRAQFRVNPSGLWLTERVWEPEVPATLAQAGMAYTMVDANQFVPARPWLPRTLQIEEDGFWDLLGSYTTDYAGASIRLFPGSKRLRYWLPFQPVEQTIEFLRRLRRDRPVAITFADDGEKFGLWPKTFQWVYDEGWLEQWFSALEREREWLVTTTFQEYVRQAAPDGSAYLPCGSYEEMLEWSGGQFRNFFTKYPEANAMYHKMLSISRTIQGVASGEWRVASEKRKAGRSSSLTTHHSSLLAQARRELYMAQCNCAYWHGVFGGLYLSHLRRAIQAHLIAAEQLTDQLVGQGPSVASVDADGDGRDEVQLKTAAMRLLIDPDEGGAVTEWSLSGPRLNLLDTLSRRDEPYHETLKAARLNAAAGGGGVPRSIHEILGAKEAGLGSWLVYDDHRRSLFLDYALQSLPTLQEVACASWGERRLWSSGPYQRHRGGGDDGRSMGFRIMLSRQVDGRIIRKRFRISVDQPTLECDYELEGRGVPVIGLECNLALRDERYLGTPQQQPHAREAVIREPAAGVSLTLLIDPPAELMYCPIETVSESEGGLERTYQGLSLMCFWILDHGHADPGGHAESHRMPRWRGRLRWTVEAL